MFIEWWRYVDCENCLLTPPQLSFEMPSAMLKMMLIQTNRTTEGVQEKMFTPCVYSRISDICMDMN